MTKPLFENFDPVSAKAFKQKIQYDLKGASYNDTLVTTENDGISIKPFYHSDDLQHVRPVPGMPSQWSVGEEIFIINALQSRDTATSALENGVEALYFKADTPFDYKVLLEGVPKDIPIFLNLGFLDSKWYEDFYAFAKMLNVTIKLDIIHHLVDDGNWFSSLEKDHSAFHKIVKDAKSSVTVDTTIYQNAGATIVQQLAYGIAHLNEYLNSLRNRKIALSQVIFEVAQGSNYFFEISKLRALRQLTSILLKGYEDDDGTNMFAKAELKIIARPTLRNKTIYDYNTNMLRTTTECMSAVLGGADIVVNAPYDVLYHKTNDFGQRISRNQLIILKEESYFDNVQNPSDGTYYIEEITRQLGDKALQLVKDIENSGGFLKQIKEGTIQRKIKESAKKEQDKFDNEELILLGTNRHPNPQDKMKDSLELYPFLKTKPRKTIVIPIIPTRLAESVEQERLKSEK